MAISGCGDSGPKLCPVAGKVTFRGKPVSEGSIRFRNPQVGIDMVAKLGPDGDYEIVTASGSGLPEGTYRVAIMPGGQSAPVGTFVSQPASKRLDIPGKYHYSETSGLTVTVKSGIADFNIDMRPDK